MTTNTLHPLELPKSSHIRSYERFRSSIPEKITSWLEKLIASLDEEGKLDFNPKLKMSLSGYSGMPAQDMENECKLKGKTLSDSLTAQLKLSEDQRETREWELGEIPLITKRGSFIFRSQSKSITTERCLVAQFTKASGVFFNWEEANESRKIGKDFLGVKVRSAVATFRPENGIHFSIRKEVEPNDEGLLRVVFPNRKSARMATFLDALGFSREEQENVFSRNLNLLEDIIVARESSIGKQDISQIAACIGLGSWVTSEQLSIGEADKAKIREKIQRNFFSSSVGKLGREQINRKIRLTDPSYNESSLCMTRGDIAGIIKLFISEYLSKKIQEDDPWDLGNLRVRLVGDYLDAALDHWCHLMKREVLRLIDKAVAEGNRRITAEAFLNILEDANRDDSGMSHLSRLVNRWMIHSPMSQIVSRDRNNLLEAVALTQKISFSGWDGVAIGHERDPRDVHWSHYGRICPLDTPQSDDVGVSLSFAVGSRVNESGIIETACQPVFQKENGEICIGDKISWLSPWDESAMGDNEWIAFPDQKDLLLEGKRVEVHRGPHTLRMVEPSQVKYIHCAEAALYSLSANLIPFLRHNDPIRGVMACGFMKQALPLKGASVPRINTGFEKLIPETYEFSYGFRDKGQMAYGQELLVAYLPWKGWNFEDAFVVSRTASTKLTSVEEKEVFIKLHTSMAAQMKNFMSLSTSWKKELPNIDLRRYDEKGIIKQGETVRQGDYLVIETASRRSRNKKKSMKLLEHIVDKDVRGCITSVDVVSDANGPALIRIIITGERPAAVGDKLANRHGHKGVISKIFEDYEMPYFYLNGQHLGPSECPCKEQQPHCHFELLINPITVLSRMNVGQLYETIAARRDDFKSLPEKISVYDPFPHAGRDKKIEGEIFWGEQYIMRLDHDAINKLHARSRVPHAYSSFVEQPLKGRRMEGGQRLGEMEVWALMAHNASSIMNELLTLKSDNPRERKRLFLSILKGLAGKEPESRLPEALRTMAACLSGLGIELSIWTKHGKIINPINKQCHPDQADAIGLSLLRPGDFLKHISGGEVRTPITSGRNYKYKYHPEGLESWQIFGPEEDYACACGLYKRDENAAGKRDLQCEKCHTPLIPSYQRRLRMGHIKLVRSVPNPLIMMMEGNELREYLGLISDEIYSLLNGELKIDFSQRGHSKDEEDIVRFLTRALNSSSQFKEGLKKIIKAPLMVEPDTPSSALKSKDYSALRELLFEMLRKEGGLKVEEFVTKAIARYVKKIKGGLSGLFQAVMREEKISGIDLIDDMLRADVKTLHLSLDILPVIPPELRSRFRIPQGRYRAHDLTVLYKQVLNANTNLEKDLKGLTGATDSDERRRYMQRRVELQLAVAQLFCNEKLSPRKKALDYSLPQRSPRFSLSSHLEGKEGLIINNLLGKRVDFSGRAVIVPDPFLPMDQCRLPFALAIDLFYPQLIAALGGLETQEVKQKIDRARLGDQESINEIKETLREVVQSYNVLLNRQPTLHRLGLLGFKASLGEGSAVAIPSLVTKGFNADFDGDQMAIYVPLTAEARKEVPSLYPSANIWHPADGRFALSTAQDIALGGYLMQEKYDKGKIAEYFEGQRSETNIISIIDDFKNRAFETSTYAGISISPDDLQGIQGVSAAGDIDQAKQIQKNIEDQAENASIKKIRLSEAGGKKDNMPTLIGRIFPERNRSNLVEGLRIGEQLLLAFGGRRNLVDTKLSTAEGGALTKDFVSATQQIWITEMDCKSTESIQVGPLEELWIWADGYTGKELKSIVEREFREDEKCQLSGLLYDIKGFGSYADFEFVPEGSEVNWYDILDRHPTRIPPRLVGVRIQRRIGATHEERKKTLYLRLYGRILANNYLEYEKGYYIDSQAASNIADKIIETNKEAYVRSPLTCAAKSGICQCCYGISLSHAGNKADKWGVTDLAPKNTRVGIIAAQSVGEPGTQMALGKKHVTLSTAREKDSVGIEDVKKFMQSNSPLFYFEDAMSVSRDTLDHYYRAHGIHIACVHFEVLFRGLLMKVKKFYPKDYSIGLFKKVRNYPIEAFSWIASTSHPDPYLEVEKNALHVLAVSALIGDKDRLQGLKQHALIGGHLPFSREGKE